MLAARRPQSSYSALPPSTPYMVPATLSVSQRPSHPHQAPPSSRVPPAGTLEIIITYKVIFVKMQIALIHSESFQYNCANCTAPTTVCLFQPEQYIDPYRKDQALFLSPH